MIRQIFTIFSLTVFSTLLLQAQNVVPGTGSTGHITIKRTYGTNNQTLAGLELATQESMGGSTQKTWTLYTAGKYGGYGVAPEAFEIYEYPQTYKRFQILPNGNTTIFGKMAEANDIAMAETFRISRAGVYGNGQQPLSLGVFLGKMQGGDGNPYTRAEFRMSYQGNQSNNWSNILTADRTIMTLQGDGKVGFGTSTPEAKVQIKGFNGGVAGLVIGGPNNLNNFGLYQNLKPSLAVYPQIDEDANSFPFYVGQNGGSDLFWVRADGQSYFRSKVSLGTVNSLDNAALTLKNNANGGWQHLAFDGNTDDWFMGSFGGGGFFIAKDNFSSTNAKFTIIGDRVGIGTTTPDTDALLTVKGKANAREVKVHIEAGKDIVFQNDYNLMPLEQIDAFIQQNKHLPEVAPARVMEKEGLELGKFNMTLLQKVEELTLHTIAQEKKIKQKDADIRDLKQQVRLLMKRIEKLEKNK
ncbi:MAG TPA: hypothetical protein DCS93_21105 [Microscillaceae bacterium]|nr:hypothetical protein [Microscillaceae bacterium]